MEKISKYKRLSFVFLFLSDQMYLDPKIIFNITWNSLGAWEMLHCSLSLMNRNRIWNFLYFGSVALEGSTFITRFFYNHNIGCPTLKSHRLHRSVVISFWSFGINDSRTFCIEDWIPLKSVLGGVKYVSLFIMSHNRLNKTESVIFISLFLFGCSRGTFTRFF